MPKQHLNNPSEQTEPWAGMLALVVGRDERLNSTLRDTLHKIGMRSSYAATVPEAMAEAHRHRPSLLIVEIDLDAMQSGLWLARTLRASYGVSVLFVTEHPDGELRQVIAENGGGGILRRPFQRDQLAQSLRLVMDWYILRTRSDQA
jgi:DNA-binding response OmpR family regulator